MRWIFFWKIRWNNNSIIIEYKSDYFRKYFTSELNFPTTLLNYFSNYFTKIDRKSVRNMKLLLKLRSSNIQNIQNIQIHRIFEPSK